MTNDVLITDGLVEKAVDAARRAGKGCSPLEDMAYVTIRAALAVAVPEITARCATLVANWPSMELTIYDRRGIESSIRLLGE